MRRFTGIYFKLSLFALIGCSPVQSGVLTGGLEDYRLVKGPIVLADIPNNASGICWMDALSQYLVVQNNAGIIYRYDQDFNYLGKIAKEGNIHNDMEGLACLPGSRLLVATEISQVHKFNIDANTQKINGNFDVSQAYIVKPMPLVSNKGLEGIAIRRSDNEQPIRVYVGEEGGSASTKSKMSIRYFDLPKDNLSRNAPKHFEKDLDVHVSFDAEKQFRGYITDLAGMTIDPTTGHLIIVSQESHKAIEVNAETGEVLSELMLDPKMEYEGVTFGPDNELVFVIERHWLEVYKRKK